MPWASRKRSSSATSSTAASPRSWPARRGRASRCSSDLSAPVRAPTDVVTSEARSDPGSIGVAELLSHADTGEPLLLLDVRNDEEFETWRLESRRPIETVHIPYFDFIEDPAAAIARLPRRGEIVAVCAQGGSSVMVVDTLREAGIAARS